VLLLVGQFRLDNSSDSVAHRFALSWRQLCLAMRSISMQSRQLLLVGQFLVDGNSESAYRAHNQQFQIIKDDPLPWNKGRKRRTVSMNLDGVCRSARPTSR